MEDIVAAVAAVHHGLGGGLTESVYQRALAAELPQAQCEVVDPVVYTTRQGHAISVGFVRYDIVYNNDTIIEVKRELKNRPKTGGLAIATQAQALAYWRNSGQKKNVVVVIFWLDTASAFLVAGPTDLATV